MKTDRPNVVYILADDMGYGDVREFCPGSGGWSSPTPWSEEIASLPPIQLYDLSADVGERTNVQAEYPEVVASLTALMTQYVRNGRSTPGEPQSNTGPAYWPQLNWMMDPGEQV